MSRRQHDAGLRAVARIRDVQQRDSRLEVVEARRAQARSVAALDELCAMLTSPMAVDGPASGFATGRTALLGLVEPIARARTEVAAADARTVDALARWNVARSRLAAVEGLLERRAAARAAEARRVEARELDDIAGRLREAARRRDAHQPQEVTTP